MTAFVGGCLCGNVRFEARDKIDACYCHCRMCQRSSGAPALAWASFPTASFSYTREKPATYQSSESGRRDFCPACGTQIAFRDTKTPERIDVNIPSLDDPASIEPEYHTWVESRIPWLVFQDELPCYVDDGPG